MLQLFQTLKGRVVFDIKNTDDDYDEIKEIYLDLKNKFEHEKKVMEALNSKKYNVKKTKP